MRNRVSVTVTQSLSGQISYQVTVNDMFYGQYADYDIATAHAGRFELNLKEQGYSDEKS